jgi:hypothetical protein
MGKLLKAHPKKREHLISPKTKAKKKRSKRGEKTNSDPHHKRKIEGRK